MQNPLNQEVSLSHKPIAIYIDREDQWRIMHRNLIASNSKLSCYQCQKKNQCSARAQFMKCDYCSQVNKVFDPDPLFYVDVFCQNCSKRIKIPKNGSVYKCPFCFVLNRKTNR